MREIQDIREKTEVHSRKYKVQSRKTEGQCPRSATSYPRSEGQCPRSEASYPRSEGQCPRSATSYPRSEGQCPRSATSCPRSEGQCPRSEASYPRSEGQCPRSEVSIIKINEENIQYSTINIQCKSWEKKESRSDPSASGISPTPTPPRRSSPKGTFEERKRRIEEKEQSQFSALKGRIISARGNALGLNEHAILIAPRSTANYGDAIAWGKINSSRIENRSLSSQYIKNGSLEGTKRLAVSNRLAHIRSFSTDCFVSRNDDNSICQRTDDNYKTIYLN